MKTTMIFILLALVIELSLQVNKNNRVNDPLNYDQTKWPEICRTGKKNSPINFPEASSNKYINSTEHFKILSSHYEVLQDRAWTVRNSRKFLVNVTSSSHVMVEKNKIKYRYNLVDMHLHVKAEHTFLGQVNDMELHLVHSKDTNWLKAQGVKNDPDSENKYMVIGILFKAGGPANPLITQFDFKNLKPMKNLDLSRFAKSTNNFYHYEGGLTTPACSEAVNWVVLQNIELMSTQQFIVLNKWVSQHYKEGNGRKVKPLFDRKIYFAENTKASKASANQLRAN